MKNFKGLSKYAQGGIKTEDFSPSNSAATSMIGMANSSMQAESCAAGPGDRANRKRRRACAKHARRTFAR